MSNQPRNGAPRPGNTVITASGAHAGTVVETRPPLFCVVTLRGTFWFDSDIIQEVTREGVRLVCEIVDLERYARPGPGTGEPGG